ncbi:hypothetical protein BOTBODRAFT_176822 [Botryobasidium botryosum FD-172 SS1]|uniref:Uncharacterized protein n=1 Tax=Botryobasidium botryosum (strain FD-172 SS1) TaxID=930990 RepID=A0A067M8E2_BOTB1|nr:hypothetical protein BOTBODRAFT_176822 [Botryobasidium botryosum FD-172 SS1]
MDAVASEFIPRLIQQLFEQALEDDVPSHHETDWKLPAYDLLAPFHSPTTTHYYSIQHIDREAELLSQACEYAARALSAFAENMSAEIRHRRNQLLPVHRLPSEVLALIFQLAVDSKASQAMPLHKKAPFSLSHVSRRWRDVVVEKPSLDIELAVRPMLYDISEDEDPWELRFHRAIWPEHSGDATDLMRPIFPHVDRWRSVVFDGTNIDKTRLKVCVPDAAPNLKKLHLIGTGFDAREVIPPSTPLFRDLHLFGVWLPLRSSLYTGLTSLAMHYLDFDEVTTLFQFLRAIGAGCPLLEYLKLQEVAWDVSGVADLQSPNDGGSQPISMPCLKKLKLWELDHRIGMTQVHPYLSSIATPPDAQLSLQVHARRVKGDFRDMFPSTGFLSSAPPICWLYFTLVLFPLRGSNGHQHLALDAGDFDRGRSVRVVLLGIHGDATDQLLPYFAGGLPTLLKSLALEAMDSDLFSCRL